jgi:hypothetical protein
VKLFYEILFILIPITIFNNFFFYSTDWRDFVREKLATWSNTYMDWLLHFPGPKHVLFYDNLVADVEKELKSLIQFLNVTLPEPNLLCAMARKEGIYRRRRRLLPFDPFTPVMKESLRKEQSAVYVALANNISSASPPPIT